MGMTLRKKGCFETEGAFSSGGPLMEGTVQCNVTHIFSSYTRRAIGGMSS